MKTGSPSSSANWKLAADPLKIRNTMEAPPSPNRPRSAMVLVIYLVDSWQVALRKAVRDWRLLHRSRNSPRACHHIWDLRDPQD